VWSTASSRAVYENPWIRVREDQVSRPDGGEGVYGVVEVRSPAVFVVAVTDADEVLLVEVHRYTTGRPSLEVPAGGSDGEDLLVGAQRELREETGHVASDWRALGQVFSLNGVADAPGQVFLARGLTHVGGEETEAEGIASVRAVPVVEVVAMVARGEITDNESLGALLMGLVALGRVA
jgi:8-oxo-dGTP pyrophosphatase MutT (NUDIX family)